MAIYLHSDTKIHYRVSGQGNPVLFLHGFLEDATMWQTISPAIEELGFCCYCIDLPGHGLTKWGKDTCSMVDMAAIIFDFCVDHNLKNPIVFGHSMGGYVGLELAKRMPINLTLINSNFWEDSEERKKNRNRVIEIVEQNKSRFIDEAIPNLFSPSNRESCQLIIDELKENAKRLDANAIIACSKGLRDRTRNDALLNRQHITLIHGKNDPIVPTEKLFEELSKISGSFTLFQLKNCGHMSVWESADSLISCMKMIVFR